MKVGFLLWTIELMIARGVLNIVLGMSTPSTDKN